MAPHPPLDDPSDDELVRRAQQGDRPAYGELVRRHQTAALRVATAVCGSSEEARDIVQDALVQGYRSLHRYRGDAPVRSWMLRIVANHAKNALRSGSRRRGREERFGSLQPAAPLDPVGDDVSSATDAASMLAMLAALSVRDRQVLACRFVAGLSEAETAATLRIPVGTVKSRAARALDRARGLLALAEVARG